MPNPIGRPRTCECGACAKCRQREATRRWYERKSIEERRALIARRDRESVRKRDRARNASDERRASRRERVAEWSRQNRDKVRAHLRVHRAVASGKLSRLPCEVCGATDGVHAHHDDYSAPLDVRWLCAQHHAQHHAKGRPF